MYDGGLERRCGEDGRGPMPWINQWLMGKGGATRGLHAVGTGQPESKQTAKKVRSRLCS